METNARYMTVGIAVLAIVAAVFGFVYWLNNNVGLRARTLYRVRFENTVSGLQVGAAVQFNGIRVGEVASLQLDKDDPRSIIAAITVDSATPVRADTKVGIAFQGLMGTAEVSLSGGASNSPPLPAPTPAAAVGPASKSQLVIPMPTAVIALQSQRMLARSPDGQISQIGDAQWSDSLPDLLQAKVAQTLADAGLPVASAASDQQLAASDQLLIDLRDFAITNAPDPVANVEFSVKLVDPAGHIVATRLFRATAPVKGAEVAQIVAAFDVAFAIAATDLETWIAQAIQP